MSDTNGLAAPPCPVRVCQLSKRFGEVDNDKRPRAEYVLGRILEAKGDAAGAKEHMAKYLMLEPAPADVDLVRGHIDNLGKPQAKDVDPELEPL
jgi:hypothetical protein